MWLQLADKLWVTEMPHIVSISYKATSKWKTTDVIKEEEILFMKNVDNSGQVY